MKVAKAVAHYEKIVNAPEKMEEKFNNELEIKQGLLDTKMQIAALKAKEEVVKQQLKAQQLGTERVQLAKQRRQLSKERMESQSELKQQ